MLPMDEVNRLIAQIASEHERVARLTGIQLESIVAQTLAQQAKTVDVSRQLAAQVDMMLAVQSDVMGMQKIAVEAKALERSLTVADLTRIRAATDQLDASRFMLVTNALLTEQAAALVRAEGLRIDVVDRIRLTEWIDAYQEQQVALAATLAYQLERLPLEDLVRIDEIALQSLITDEAFDGIAPADSQQRIVQVDRVPWRILQNVLRDPRHLEALTPRQFEEFTAEILEALGFKDILLTPPSGDGGRDVIASGDVNGIPLTFYFECKKYAKTHKVQVATLRSLLGVVAHEATKANVGVLVTTSTFTEGARQLILSDCRLRGKD